ncbi:MAG: glutamine phosphoribosylpyrophosphate amidotransferase [Chloroflexi bacterium]|nr:MAG: glutamine phosphoribosylpyrophosphate amidotransferase [Chloroflexota bacterium]
MCGIVGYFRKLDSEGPIGEVMLRMITAMGCRGPDSTGLALYGGKRKTGAVVRVKLADDEVGATQAKAILHALEAVTEVKTSALSDGVLRLELGNGASATAVERAVLRSAPGSEVFSIGRRLDLVKRVGTAADLDASFHVRGFRGTHAIGHTRLATESKVDISHSQPFWAHGRPDLATVHNGHITNYVKLRDLFEMRGHVFYTHNDSEIIPAYLGEEIGRGASLEHALRRSVAELDGTFSYLAATATEFGFAKDGFSAKPLLMAETADAVVVATEEIAIFAACGRDAHAAELPAREVRVWSR